MEQSTVQMDVRKLNGWTSVVDIRGNVTAACESILMDTHSRASSPTTQAIVLNFTALDYMNSGGIGLLVTLLIRANRQGQRLLAYGLTEHYRQIFQLTRLDQAVAIYDTEIQALDEVERSGRTERPAEYGR
jgi:anti-sigma B factor antagonist